MKRYEGILLCTDLDGTLLNNDRTISKENLEAIAEFKEQGGAFTIVTGRSHFAIYDICQAVNPNVPVVCFNGACLYDWDTRELLPLAVLPDEVHTLLACVEQALPGVGMLTHTAKAVYFYGDNPAMDSFARVSHLPKITGHYQDVSEPIIKMVFATDEDEQMDKLTELLQSHPDVDRYDFIRSEKNLYEILPRGVNKGTALQNLVQYLGMDMRNTVAAGDYDNDIQMLRTAGIGYAVANARQDVKEAADRVTVSNQEHAIAAIIAEL